MRSCSQVSWKNKRIDPSTPELLLIVKTIPRIPIENPPFQPNLSFQFRFPNIATPNPTLPKTYTSTQFFALIIMFWYPSHTIDDRKDTPVYIHPNQKKISKEFNRILLTMCKPLRSKNRSMRSGNWTALIALCLEKVKKKTDGKDVRLCSFHLVMYIGVNELKAMI